MTCTLCAEIPDYKAVETLHTSERLPAAVDQLTTLGGFALERELRICPQCQAYFLYHYDHDSQSGVGYGYTDESIQRISSHSAKRFALWQWLTNKNDERLQKEIKRWQDSVTPEMQKKYISGRSLIWEITTTAGGNLRVKNLSKEITEESVATLLVNLVLIEKIKLHTITHCWITDSNLEVLPREIALLSNLKNLCLKNNRLTELPWNLRQMKSLNALDITGNPIADLPSSLKNLPLTKEENS